MNDVDLIEPAPESFGDRIGRAAAVLSRFSWQSSLSPGELRIALGGRITLDEAPALWKRVAEVLDRVLRLERVRVDLSRVETMDGACLALLAHLESELRRRRVVCELAGAPAEVQRLLDLHRRHRRRRPVRRPRHLLEQVGAASAELFVATLEVLGFFGQLVRAAGHALRKPHTLNLRDVALTMERAGAD
ncbi:MAG TPA: STAS domain-containing protein, partial [Polyangiaceae bacterium]|nr:STAS domain-containing protein [Polyangiaceae bacterium]